MLFTVITVTLNAERTIAETVRSVLGQSFEDFEYIVQDGGSTDGTIGIVKGLRDERVRIVREEDEGISDAFNRGISKAGGEYVLILSSDDVLYERTTLEKLAGVIRRKNKPLILHGDTVHGYDQNPRVVRGATDLSYLRRGMIINHSTCIVHRDVYRMYGPFDLKYRMAMDYEFVLRLYLAKVTFHYVPIIITRIGMKGISSRSTLTALREVRQIQRDHNTSRAVALWNYSWSVVRMAVRVFLTRLNLYRLVEFYQRTMSINKKFPLR